MTVEGFDDTVVLRDVVGHAVTFGGFTFVPGVLWTAEPWDFSPSACALENQTTCYLRLGEQQDGANELEYSNALWVRARLPIVFGFAPPTCSRPLRLQFLDVGFVAVTEVAPERVAVVPFVCVSQELQAVLQFGRRVEREEREAISAAFWELLASEPDGLANYADWVWVHDGHGPNGYVVGYWDRQFQVRGWVPENLWA